MSFPESRRWVHIPLLGDGTEKSVFPARQRSSPRGPAGAPPAARCPRDTHDTSTAGTSVLASTWTGHETASVSITNTSWRKPNSLDCYTYPQQSEDKDKDLIWVLFLWASTKHSVRSLMNREHGAMVTTDIRSLTEQTSCRNGFCINRITQLC